MCVLRVKCSELNKEMMLGHETPNSVKEKSFVLAPEVCGIGAMTSSALIDDSAQVFVCCNRTHYEPAIADVLDTWAS